MRPPETDVHCATIVVAAAITKPEALAVVALVVDAPVEQPHTARPWVALPGGAWAQIEIPKFGEPPPLAIDVLSPLGGEHAMLHALTLMARLEKHTGWPLRLLQR